MNSEAKEFIDEIRDSFLINTDGESERIKKGARNMHIKLNNALRLLSEDLYSKKSHYILELIQNADDNEYSKDVTPFLKIIVNLNKLVIVNNEIGFNKENIQAICGVGESSKSKDKIGYIGEKGIGFKSVFTVSDSPEIHSNGFHFRFDRTDSKNLLGYVVPEWIDSENEYDTNQTTIVLPAADNHKFEISTLNDINAQLLLFLNELRTISIQEKSKLIQYNRTDISGKTILSTKENYLDKLDSDKETIQRYIRIEHTFDIDSSCLDHDKRPNIAESKIVLAFSINENNTVNPDRSSHIFAFLPVCQAGFKFEIQADFILSSSREGILTDRPWNINVRNEIANAFVMAVEEFKKSDVISNNYLKYVPSSDDIVDPFFFDIRNQIINILSDSECVLSASNEWKFPNNLRMASSKFRELLPSKIANELFGFDYVNNKVRGVESVLGELGVRHAGIAEILSIFDDKSDWLSSQPLSWKSKLYAYIADNLDEALAAGLYSLPCLPTSDGKFVVPNDKYVFYPLSKEKKYGFEHELSIIDAEIYDAARKISNDNVVKLFEAMDVRADDPFQIITAHIFPLHNNNAWKESNQDALVGHLKYIKDKFVDYAKSMPSTEDAYKSIKDKIWIGTKKNEGGWTFQRINNLYLSKEYNPEFCIETLLGNSIEKVKLISDKYISTNLKKSNNEIQSWNVFLIKLGIRVSPAVIKSGADWLCTSELAIMLNSESSAIRRATLECMNKNWNEYENCITYKAFYRNSTIDKISSFATNLRATIAPTKKRIHVALADAYYSNDEIKRIFGEGLPFIDADLDAPMLDACNVTYKLTAKTLIKRIKELKNGSKFTTKQLHLIYRAIDDRFWESSSAEITNYFAEHKLINVKESNNNWYSLNEVCWNSSGSEYLDNIYPPIHSLYRDFNRLFLDRLKISKTLPIDSMVKALLTLDNVDNLQQKLEIALNIYRRANNELAPKFGRHLDPLDLPEWTNTFLDEKVFINQRGEMVSQDSYLFANDLPEIAKLFEDDNDISILDVPTNEVPRLSRLLQVAEVPLLSQSIAIQVIDSDPGIVNHDLSDKVRRSLIYFARLVYTKRHADFEKAIIKGLFASLRNFDVVEVSDVNLLVNLHNIDHETTTDIAISNNRLLYRVGTKSLKDRIAKQLCEYLEIYDDLEDAFARILTESNDNSIEEYLSVKHIRELPQDIFNEIFNDKLAAIEDNIDELNIENLDETVDDSFIDTDENIENGSKNANDMKMQNLSADISKEFPDSKKENSSNSGSATSDELPDEVKIQSQKSITTTSSSNSEDGGQSESAINSKKALQDSRPQSPNINIHNNSDINSTDLQNSTQGKKSSKSTSLSRARFSHTNSGHLLSYAVVSNAFNTEPQEEDPDKYAARKATELAAVNYFIDTQAKNWQKLTVMKANNPGFDIYAINQEGQEEFIEVKGQSRAWTAEGVGLTPRELITAYEKGNLYWLCVVEFANDEKRRQLHLIRNPFGLISQFKFDVGWKSVAETLLSSPQIPKEQMNIEIQGMGRGLILSVRTKGKFYNLHIQLVDGRQINKPFNPALMKLSVESTWQE